MRAWRNAPVLGLACLVLSTTTATAASRPAAANPRSPQATTATTASRPTAANPQSPQAVTIQMTARRWEFVPDVIEVVEGDQVTLAVKSADVTHGIEIKKLTLKKKIPKGGEVVTLSFTAPAPGDYEMKCSEYCGRGHRSMKARLVVKPRGE